MPFTNLFATLLLAHLLADFPLQTNFINRLKNRSAFGIFAHVAVHSAVTALLLEFQSGVKVSYLLMITFIGVSHFIIDWMKCAVGSAAPTLRMFLVDQYLHVLSLIAAIGICKQMALPLPVPIIPEAVLFRSLSFATFLALMVLGWLWLNTLDRQKIHQNPYLAWSQQRLLLIEQWLGLLLLVWLVVITFGSVDI